MGPRDADVYGLGQRMSLGAWLVEDSENETNKEGIMYSSEFLKFYDPTRNCNAKVVEM